MNPTAHAIFVQHISLFWQINEPQGPRNVEATLKTRSSQGILRDNKGIIDSPGDIALSTCISYTLNFEGKQGVQEFLKTAVFYLKYEGEEKSYPIKIVKQGIDENSTSYFQFNLQSDSKISTVSSYVVKRISLIFQNHVKTALQTTSTLTLYTKLARIAEQKLAASQKRKKRLATEIASLTPLPTPTPFQRFNFDLAQTVAREPHSSYINVTSSGTSSHTQGNATDRAPKSNFTPWMPPSYPLHPNSSYPSISPFHSYNSPRSHSVQTSTTATSTTASKESSSVEKNGTIAIPGLLPTVPSQGEGSPNKRQKPNAIEPTVSFN